MSYSENKLMNLKDGRLLLKTLDIKSAVKANAENLYTYRETAGDIVAVGDAVAEAVKQMRIGIEPVQDLHGYENPWPAGGGKNLIPYPYKETTKTVNGITFTDNGNGTISVNGTANGNAVFILADSEMWKTQPAGNYVLSGCPSGGGQNTYRIHAQLSSGSDSPTGMNDYGSASGAGFANEVTLKSGYSIYIFIGTGITLNNAMFKPMIEAGSTATAWVPYENICPISGWTGAKVGVAEHYSPMRPDAVIKYTDKSVTWDITKYPFIKANGTATGGKSYSGLISTTNQSFRLPTGTYTLKLIGTVSNVNVIVSFESGSGLSIVTLNKDNMSYTFTFAQEYGISWYCNAQNGSAVDAEFAIVYSEGTCYDVSFPDSAGTVYGGTLTVNQDGTGTLVVDRDDVDLGTLDWVKGTDTMFTCATDLGYYRSFSQSNVPNFITSIYVTENWAVINSGQQSDCSFHALVYDGGQQIRIYDSRYADVESLKTALTGQKLVFELATPVTYQLTNQQVVELLKGNNNIWADTGDIESILYPTTQYHDDRYADRIYETTESQAVASFSDGADGVPLKKLEVAIEPVQDLHGYDNPWPGGGGKNLFKPNENDYPTGKGVTITFSDGAIYVNGTCSETFSLHLDNWTKADADILPLTSSVHTFSIKVNVENIPATTPTLFAGYFLNGNPSQSSIGLNTKATFTPNVTSDSDEVWTRCYINIASGVTYNNMTIKPQLEIGSDIVNSWSPYSNICPISGWTGANVSRTGKNLVGITLSQAGDNNVLSNVFSLKAGTYTLSLKYNGIPTYGIYLRNGNNVSSPVIVQQYNANTLTFTLEHDYEELCFSMYYGQGITPSEVTEIQIEQGSTATTYEPYSGETTEYAFPTSAGTVYGGTLTIHQDGSGELVVDRASYNMSEVQVFTGGWGATSESDTFCNFNTGINIVAIDATKTKASIRVYKSVQNGYHYSVLVTGQLSIRGEKKVLLQYGWDGSTAESACTAMKAWEQALNGADQIVLNISPVTYPLTNQQVIALLKGSNNIWADTGDVAVEYPADTKLYIDGKLAEIQAMILENI